MSEFEEAMSGRAMFGMGITPSGKAQSSHNSAEHKSAGRPLKNMWSPVELYVSDEGDEVGYYVKIEYTDTQLITGRVITTFLSVSKDTGEFGPVVRKGRIGEWVPMEGETYNPRRPYFVFTSKSCPLLIYRIRLDNDGNVVEEHLWYAEIGKQLGEHGFVVYVKPKAEVGNDALVGRVRGVVLGGGRERLVTGATPVKEEGASAGEESATLVKEEGASVDAVMAELNDELNRLVEEEDEESEVKDVTEVEPEATKATDDTEVEPEATGGEQGTSESVIKLTESRSAFKAPSPGIPSAEIPATFEVPEL